MKKSMTKSNARFNTNKKGKKKKHDTSQPLQGVDDFQAQGVSFEESAEKWRSGDAGKSARFYLRALDAYDQGIVIFPDSFDLVYNKARVLFTIAQHPRLLKHSPSSRHEALKEALSANRRALQLQSENADALFNIAQVLCSLAEGEDDPEAGGEGAGRGSYPLDALALIEEAVVLLERCLSIQERVYQETHKPVTQQHTESDGLSTVNSPSPELQEEEQQQQQEEEEEEEQETWAAIEEPITISSLVDTSVALLQAITTLCNLHPNSDLRRLDDITTTSENLLQVRLSRWLELAGEEAKSEYVLAEANLKVALLEAQYRTGNISHEFYNKSLTESFQFIAVQPENGVRDPAALCAFADALVDFVLAVEGDDDLSTMKWTKLTAALSCLTEASKDPHAQNLSRIHQGRGDIELLRYSFSRKPDISANLRSDEVRLTLLQNAEKFYRGAAGFAKVESENGNGSREIEPVVAEAVARCFENDDSSPLLELQGALFPEHILTVTLEGMAANSLISSTNLELWKREKKLSRLL